MTVDSGMNRASNYPSGSRTLKVILSDYTTIAKRINSVILRHHMYFFLAWFVGCYGKTGAFVVIWCVGGRSCDATRSAPFFPAGNSERTDGGAPARTESQVRRKGGHRGGRAGGFFFSLPFPIVCTFSHFDLQHSSQYLLYHKYSFCCFFCPMIFSVPKDPFFDSENPQNISFIIRAESSPFAFVLKHWHIFIVIFNPSLPNVQTPGRNRDR